MRVVIADSDPMYAAAVASVISDEPGVVWAGSANSVSALLDLMTTAHPDVAAVDVRLPGGGLATVARLLYEAGHSCRLVAMTPVVTPTTRALAIRVGAVLAAKADGVGLLAAVMAPS